MSYHEALLVAQEILSPAAAGPETELAPSIGLLSATPGARVLDLGCGAGAGVRYLTSQGFDAYGVDIFEYWGSQSELFWQRELPMVDATRLRVATLQPYRLPYPDDHFDHVVSSQVIEHVDDRAAMFAELARVLKPGGTSAHIYPDAWHPLLEGHINVPFSALCRSRLYLKLAALLGFRSARQAGLDWRSVYRANVAQMQMTHYHSRRRVLREARSAGLTARFAAADHVRCSGTRWSVLHRGLSRLGLGWLANLAGREILQPMLVVAKPN